MQPERARPREGADGHGLVVAAAASAPAAPSSTIVAAGRGRRPRYGEPKMPQARITFTCIRPPRHAAAPRGPGRGTCSSRQPGAEQDLAHPDEQRQCCERPGGERLPDRGAQSPSRAAWRGRGPGSGWCSTDAIAERGPPAASDEARSRCPAPRKHEQQARAIGPRPRVCSEFHGRFQTVARSKSPEASRSAAATT